MLKQRLLLSLASFVNFFFLFLAHVFFVSRSEILELTLPLSEFRFFFRFPSIGLGQPLGASHLDPLCG